MDRAEYEREQRAVVARRRNGQTFQEIATEMGLAVDYVRQVHRSGVMNRLPVRIRRQVVRRLRLYEPRKAIARSMNINVLTVRKIARAANIPPRLTKPRRCPDCGGLSRFPTCRVCEIRKQVATP